MISTLLSSDASSMIARQSHERCVKLKVRAVFVSSSCGFFCLLFDNITLTHAHTRTHAHTHTHTNHTRPLTYLPGSAVFTVERDGGGLIEIDGVSYRVARNQAVRRTNGRAYCFLFRISLAHTRLLSRLRSSRTCLGPVSFLRPKKVFRDRFFFCAAACARVARVDDGVVARMCNAHILFF